MCRSANYESQSSQFHHPHHQDSDPLTITGFYLRLFASGGFESHDYDDESASKPCPIPDYLTLLLFPPLTNCNNNKNNKISNIPPFSPATVSLRRIELSTTDKDVIVFGSKQRVLAATQVLSFQLYAGKAKLLKGAIRNYNQNSLKLELCKSELIIPSSFSISELELWVSLDGHVAVGDQVTIEKATTPLSFGVDEYKKMRNNKHRTNKSKLEDIPEETEFRSDVDVGVGLNQEIEEAAIHLEMNLEVLRKALDMGIWVLCLGLGLRGFQSIRH